MITEKQKMDKNYKMSKVLFIKKIIYLYFNKYILPNSYSFYSKESGNIKYN